MQATARIAGVRANYDEEAVHPSKTRLSRMDDRFLVDALNLALDNMLALVDLDEDDCCDLLCRRDAS